MQLFFLVVLINIANRNLVILSRNQTSDNGTKLIRNIEFSFDENYKTDNDILLPEKTDIISVRKIPLFKGFRIYFQYQEK